MQPHPNDLTCTFVSAKKFQTSLDLFPGAVAECVACVKRRGEEEEGGEKFLTQFTSVGFINWLHM